MAAKKTPKPKPEPVSLNIVCSICDEPWHLHVAVNGEVSTLECVRLLKAKRWTPTITIQPRPYVQPFWPYQPPFYSTWYSTTTSSLGNQCQSAQTVAINSITATNYATPTIAMASAAA